MAILHIIARHLNADELSKLVDRSGAEDAYAFMDDGVFMCYLANTSRNFLRDLFMF